jgi:hypothetical protein
MNIEKLTKLLESEAFQNPKTGTMFFQAYIYLYEPERAYEMQTAIQELLGRLSRPNHFLDCYVLNLYDEMVAYLQSSRLGNATLFERIIEREVDDHVFAQNWTIDNVEEGAFIDFIAGKVQKHFAENAGQKRLYLLINGVGEVYPYLRASDFLKRFEKYVSNYKLILFYPGKYEDDYYWLFNQVKTDNIYRVNRLNDLI